jgi:hypothetical protein
LPISSILTLIAAVVGATTGVVSLLLLIFSAGRRIGQVETKIGDLESKTIKQAEWGELRNKVDTLYTVYVLEVLSRKNDGDDTKKGRGR